MKNFTDTSLHVYFAGNLRIRRCDGCCSRWYFTFDSMVPSAALLGLLKARSTCELARITIFIVTAMLEVTVITFTRERCEWDSGLEAATMASRMLTRTLAGLQCPGSSLKRCQKLSSKHVTRDPLDFTRTLEY